MGEHWEKLFQSSPVTKDGRYFAPSTSVVLLFVFQSSPVTKDGRYYDATREGREG